jgi:hypothetical protein
VDLTSEEALEWEYCEGRKVWTCCADCRNWTEPCECEECDYCTNQEWEEDEDDDE